MDKFVNQAIGETLKSWRGEYFQTTTNGPQKYIVNYIGEEADTTVDFIPGHRFIVTKLMKKDGTAGSRKKSFWVTDSGTIHQVSNKAWEK